MEVAPSPTDTLNLHIRISHLDLLKTSVPPAAPVSLALASASNTTNGAIRTTQLTRTREEVLNREVWGEPNKLTYLYPARPCPCSGWRNMDTVLLLLADGVNVTAASTSPAWEPGLLFPSRHNQVVSERQWARQRLGWGGHRQVATAQSEF